MPIKRSLIVAMAQNNVIGNNNELLWHIPEDFKYFKEKTLGKPVIMGRKTYESIVGYLGKPLPGRTNIVITRQDDYQISDGHFVKSSVALAVDKAMDVAMQTRQDEIFCIGGAQIYEQFLQICDRAYLTIIEKDFKGDAFFPELDVDFWQKTSVNKGKETEVFAYRFEIWDRKTS